MSDAHDMWQEVGYRQRELTITDDHLKLLRRAYVGWCYDEFGAPSIDPKRPYGNSWVLGDIAEIIGVAPLNDDGDFSPEDEERMTRMHAEAGLVLQVALRDGEFPAPGRYVRDAYGFGWKRADQ